MQVSIPSHDSTIYRTLTKSVVISLVSYWNTRPFLYGMEHLGLQHKAQLLLDVPSAGGARLLKNEVDIALAPVITLNQLSDAEVITDYCIGATAAVKTVNLYATVPLESIQKVYLYRHSLTSVQLLRILFHEFWKKEVEWVSSDVQPELLQSGEAALVIGDKTFHWQDRFPVVYDLAEEWIRFTGKPFVFAAWITRKPISDEWKEQLNAAFAYGLSHLDEVVESLRTTGITADVLMEYYTRHISYQLDNSKREGLSLYLQKARLLPALQY